MASSIVFKDLQKLVSSYSLSQSQQQQQQESAHKDLSERLKDKPFWIWDKQQHKQEDIKTDGDCCFNHIIGLPTKEGIEKAMFDYEQTIFDSLVTQNSNNNQSWFTRPRDKNGRFMSRSTKATTAASTTTTAVAITTTPTTITAKSQPWHNKIRDSRGRFVASTAAT